MRTLFLLVLLLCLFCFGESWGLAQQSLPQGYQQSTDQKIRSLQGEVHSLKRSSRDAATGGMVSFLFGVFCALWAQNTNRSAWLWFFLGLFFSVIATIFLLIKNSDDRFDRQQRDRIRHGRP